MQDVPRPSPRSSPPSALPAPAVTIVLIALNVGAFLLAWARGADPFAPATLKLVDLGANVGVMTLHGEPWRLATAMFLHAGVLHLVMNMYGLWAGGTLVERLYGRAAFVALYVAAGLIGGLATIARSAWTPSVGASGAIFGVFGGLGAWLFAHRDRLDPAVVRSVGRNLLLFVGLNLAIGASVPGIDMAAHVGGLVGGFAFGLALEWQRRQRRSPARLAIAVVVAAAAIAGGFVALRATSKDHRPPPVYADAYAEFDRVQAQVSSTFNTMLAASHAGTLSDPEFAARMEREVLPAWRTLKQRLDTLPPPPVDLQPMHAALIAYVDARVTALEAIRQLAAGMDIDGAKVKALQDIANRALEDLNRELKRRR